MLQNIEATRVGAARRDDEVDDRAVDEALQLALRGGDPAEDADPLSVEIYDLLVQMRSYRSDVPDNIWRAGLRTVRDSVRRHSTLAPAEKSRATASKS